MSKEGFAYSTVRSYVAEISIFCKLNNFEDVTHTFAIVKMLSSVSKGLVRVRR